MWPFKKKQKEPDWKAEAFDSLQAWRAIGDEFSYLGKTMIVSAHHEIIPFYPAPIIRPCIKADYVDDCGVLHNVTFSWQECLALMRKQPNAAVKPRSEAESA